LDIGDRELADGHRAEAVTQVVKAERPEAGALLRGAVSADEPVVAET
jgi:hypothetical protein